jgi:hypothetical protein
MKPIRLSKHALGYAGKRGFAIAEVEETIRTSPWQPAESGMRRLECSKEFPFHQSWNDVFCRTKRVRPIFVEEAIEIVVVTVYTYYY